MQLKYLLFIWLLFLRNQNHKTRKYLITSLQCVGGWRERFQVFCFIFVVKNSYKKVNFIQHNFTKSLLRESISIDQFQWDI